MLIKSYQIVKIKHTIKIIYYIEQTLHTFYICFVLVLLVQYSGL